MDVDVAIEVANLELTDGDGRRVSVPPTTGSRSASRRLRPRWRYGAIPSGGRRAATAPTRRPDRLPVYTPATAEAFATYGVVDEGAIVNRWPRPRACFPSSAVSRSTRPRLRCKR